MVGTGFPCASSLCQALCRTLEYPMAHVFPVVISLYDRRDSEAQRGEAMGPKSQQTHVVQTHRHSLFHHTMLSKTARTRWEGRGGHCLKHEGERWTLAGI